MRVPAVVAAIGLWLGVVNLLVYFHEPVQRWYLPLWGRIPTAAGWMAAAAWLVVCLLSLHFRARNRRLRPRVAVLAFLLGSATFLQVPLQRTAYRTIPLGNETLLLNFTDFPSGSPLVARIRSDVERERKALTALFGVDPGRVRIALFPSRSTMHQALGTGSGAAAARAQYLTNTIYISPADWNTSFRHELVHLYQSEWARRDLGRWSRFLLRHDECLTEGLAYYLAPLSAGIGARPVDYINALDLPDAEWAAVARFQRIAPAGRPLDPSIRRTVDLFLCTYPWHLAGSESDAVALYRRITDGDTMQRPAIRTPPVGSRDPAMEALVGYVLAPHFRVRGAPDERLRTVAGFAAEGGTPGERRVLARWNAENNPSLTQRIGWEIVLDTLSTGRPQSTAHDFYARARHLAESEITDPADLSRVTKGLRRVLAEAAPRGHAAVAAYTYWRLLDLESMSGRQDPPPPPGSDLAVSRAFAESVARVREHFPTGSARVEEKLGG